MCSARAFGSCGEAWCGGGWRCRYGMCSARAFGSCGEAWCGGGWHDCRGEAWCGGCWHDCRGEAWRGGCWHDCRGEAWCGGRWHDSRCHARSGGWCETTPHCICGGAHTRITSNYTQHHCCCTWIECVARWASDWTTSNAVSLLSTCADHGCSEAWCGGCWHDCRGEAWCGGCWHDCRGEAWCGG